MFDTHSEEYILGQNIRKYRKLKSWSQTDLSNAVDVNRTDISKYENGSKGAMGYKTLKKFAAALDVSIDQLVGEESSPSSDGNIQGKLFKFVLLDSSTNDDTKALAENSEKIEYRRFEPSVKVDDKVIGAILKCTDDYYWLLGDGNLVDFNSIEHLIEKLSDFDVLEIDSINSKRNTKLSQEDFETHDDLVDFIRTRYSHLTYWGATIIKTDTAKNMFKSGTMDKYREDALSWWSATLVCEMISSILEKGRKPHIYTLITEYLYGNPEKKDRSWAKGENYFLTTFKVFDKDVYMLPKYWYKT